jgi:hypothetical protein
MPDEKPMRKIILQGGDYTGRLGQAAQDYIYVVENVATLAVDPALDGTLNLIGGYRRSRKFNATGRFEPVGAENFEVYEFAGIEDHSIFVETQI